MDVKDLHYLYTTGEITVWNIEEYVMQLTTAAWLSIPAAYAIGKARYLLNLWKQPIDYEYEIF